MIALPRGARILVVALRRLGDVLLTTPLIRSLKHAHPEASIDALVFSGTEGILAGNPDLAAVIVMPARPTKRESLALARSLWRRYDLAISTQTGDRPTWFAWAAGRRSAGLVEPDGANASVKRAALDVAAVSDRTRHRIADVLQLADALGIPAIGEVVSPGGAARSGLMPQGDYAVVHAGPMFRYKRWTDEGWRGLAAALTTRGLRVVATGGSSMDDRNYLDAVWGDDPQVRRLDGVLTWPELAALIRAARIYVGPDTSVTHLAAATGAPTVAIYGPTDPRLWGPSPVGGLNEMWQAAAPVQRRGNVWLLQNPLSCTPCQLEGCMKHRDSFSRCLDELTLRHVMGAVEQALAAQAAKS